MWTLVPISLVLEIIHRIESPYAGTTMFLQAKTGGCRPSSYITNYYCLSVKLASDEPRPAIAYLAGREAGKGGKGLEGALE